MSDPLQDLDELRVSYKDLIEKVRELRRQLEEMRNER